MKKRQFLFLITTAVILLFAISASAAMESAHFRIITSVVSGGGIENNADHFVLTSTLGQPSPLMDQDGPPISDSFILFPGFWYTLEASFIHPCEGDFDEDGDVDVFDLGKFASHFGRTNCSTPGAPPCKGNFDRDNDIDVFDLGVFATDFGRTNCPLP